MLCIVALVDCTHELHIQNIRTYHTLLLLFTAPILRVSYSFLRGLGNIAQENTTADILVEDQLQPPLDMVTVDLEQELRKLNS